MLISPRNPDTLSKNIEPNIWVARSPIKSAHKINHNSSLTSKLETSYSVYLGSKSHQLKWILGSVPILKVTIITGFRPEIL